jgi:hypothetical protein
VVPEFRMLVAAHGMAVLQQLDVWLAARREAPPAEAPVGPEQAPAQHPAPRTARRTATPASPPPPARVRLGLGIYYFEEQSSGAIAPPQEQGR